MTAAQIVASVRISQVAIWLGGTVVRRRFRAFWRKNSDSLNCSLDDSKGCWFDHVAGAGGGILDLIQQALGCDRKRALEWIAERLNLPIDGHHLDAAQRRDFIARRRAARTGAHVLVEWRDGLLATGQERRDLFFSGYHRALHHIFSCDRREDCCALAMEVADAYRDRYEELDRLFDVIKASTWSTLATLYRRQRQQQVA